MRESRKSSVPFWSNLLPVKRLVRSTASKWPFAVRQLWEITEFESRKTFFALVETAEPGLGPGKSTLALAAVLPKVEMARQAINSKVRFTLV